VFSFVDGVPKVPAGDSELVRTHTSALTDKPQRAFTAVSARTAMLGESSPPMTQSTEGGSMSTNNTQKVAVPKWMAMAAMVIGIAGGSYGIASAASSSGTTTTQKSAARPAAAARAPRGRSALGRDAAHR
jgi:hypothetical protein